MLDPLEPRRLFATTGLDPTYGTAGIASLRVTRMAENDPSDATRIRALAFTPAGATYVVLNEPTGRKAGPYYFYTRDTIVRLKPDGTPDATFGDKGRAVIGSGSSGYLPLTFAVAPGGRMFLENKTLPLLLRPDGGVLSGASRRLASTQNGVRIGTIYGATFDAAGHVYVGATFETLGKRGYATGIARYTSDGTLDTGWGDGGFASAEYDPDRPREPGDNYSQPARIAVSPDGHVAATFTSALYDSEFESTYSSVDALTLAPDGRRIKLQTIASGSSLAYYSRVECYDLRAMPDGSFLAITDGVDVNPAVVVRLLPDGTQETTPTDPSRPVYPKLTPAGTVVAAPSNTDPNYAAYFPAVGRSDDDRFASTEYFAVLGDGRLMDAVVADSSGKAPALVVRRFDGTGVFTAAAPGTASIQTATRTLDVAGTGSADTIFVRRRGDRLRVRINNGPVQAFDAADIDTIRVHGDRGDDAIDLRLAGLAKAVRLTGGLGRDTIMADHPDATLDGGADNDVLRGPGYLDGGDGNDRLYGTGLLRGGAGDDTLHPYGRGISVPAADD